MGPYGPSIEEKKALNLKTLRRLYGDLPYDELIRKADESMMKKIEEYNNEHRKTA